MRNVVVNKDFQNEGLHGCFSDAKMVSISYNLFSDYILQRCFFSSCRIEILGLRHEERTEDDPTYLTIEFKMLDPRIGFQVTKFSYRQ